ncbi:MAG: endonuclease NucS [Flavobacteriales bacterium]|jgi:RecB family endonuclease NucS|nr:endonuclease NucS [Flavobacteriales bacterium]
MGHLFEKERYLEDYIAKHGLYSKIGIETVHRQYSPKGTRDKLDFLGKMGEQKIVLELKHQDGGKSAVEQVLRYAGYLMGDNAKDSTGISMNIRKILVTGIQNRETAFAIKALTTEERENFEWYLYNYNSKTGDLDFVRITEKDIENQLSAQFN